MVKKSKYKPVVTIIGRPNVGKSTLFNRIAQKRIAITSEIPGTTRDRLYENIIWNGREFILVDTAGIEADMESDLANDINFQIDIAFKEADFLIFMVDGTTGITSQDQDAAEKLRKLKKPSLLAVNKVDNEQIEKQIAEFYKLGLGEPMPISAIHGKGTGDLLDSIINKIKKITGKPEKEDQEADITVAIVGRPNVGKSSIVNKMIGEKRAIVGNIPGTTRDSTIINKKIDNTNIKMIDTAGIRKRGKIEMGIEKFSVLRAFKAIDNSDITLLVLDATEGVVAQDLHIAGFTKDMGKGLIVVINKWDLIEKDTRTMDNYLAVLKRKFDFAYWAPVIFTSALTGKNIDNILPRLIEISKEQQKQIQTSKINSLIERLVMKKAPGMKRGIRPKLYYSTQVEEKPPTFIIFSNYPEMIHFSYLRYLENKFREEFGFDGTPIKFVIKKRT